MRPAVRLLVTLAAAGAATWGFSAWHRAEAPLLPSGNLWSRSLADAATAALCVSLAIGPLARLAPRTRSLLPWRREVGLASATAAVLHVAAYAHLAGGAA